MMGFKPSHYNKINIHIGGVYNDKQATLARFAETFRTLSPNLRARLTVENDDWPSAFAVSDLMWLHKETGIPLVFDFHHWKFCPGAACCCLLSHIVTAYCCLWMFGHAAIKPHLTAAVLVLPGYFLLGR